LLAGGEFATADPGLAGVLGVAGDEAGIAVLEPLKRLLGGDRALVALLFGGFRLMLGGGRAAPGEDRAGGERCAKTQQRAPIKSIVIAHKSPRTSALLIITVASGGRDFGC
jgi:hypothetical protein